jgi:hypothetical protein
MARFEDLTGKTFGRWYVIERAEDYILPSGKKVIMWLCECAKEGNRGVVMGSNLRNGQSTSCGCARDEKNGELGLDDLTGQTFGDLKVIKRAEDYVRKNGRLNTQWLCECQKDGNLIVAQSTNLKSEGTTSCGCVKESAIASDVKRYCVENYNAKLEHRVLINPKTDSWLRCDAYIEKTSGGIDGIYIEVHGLQHYKEDSFHYATNDVFMECQYRDRLKKDYAKKHGVYIEIDLRVIKTSKQAIEYLESMLNS